MKTTGGHKVVLSRPAVGRLVFMLVASAQEEANVYLRPSEARRLGEQLVRMAGRDTKPKAQRWSRLSMS